MLKIWLVSLLCTAAAYSSAAADKDGFSHRREDRHSLIEDIYWDARQASDGQRRLYQPRNATIDVDGMRRLFEFWTPDYNCPFLKERVGEIGDGGKWDPVRKVGYMREHDKELGQISLEQKPLWQQSQKEVCGPRMLFESAPCVLYSIGSSGESSFEQQMMHRASCEIHTFDPFIDAATKEAMRGKVGIRFHDWGAGHETALTPEGLQLKSMQDTMRELNHHWVDLLKIDIEGKEWDVLGSLLQDGGPGIHATQLLIELHYPWAMSELQIWNTLEAVALDNFRLFSVEPNFISDTAAGFMEFSYIKVSPDGHVCMPKGGNSEVHTVPFGCLRR